MKCCTESSGRYVRAGAALVVTVLASVVLCSAQTKYTKSEQKKDTSNFVVAGRDPKAFADASAMLEIPVQRVLDDVAADGILGSLDAAVGSGKAWSPVLWLQLDKLRSVRLSQSRLSVLQGIAQHLTLSTVRPGFADSSAALKAFQQGNRKYEMGSLREAAEAYQSALTKRPAYWDAWNNLALAEMHWNNDLVALFLLSALTKSNPEYVGASINCSVCLERLGRADSAYATALRVASGSAQLPMAQYNRAWFENLRGRMDSARSCILLALATIGDYPMVRWLQTINMMEAGERVASDETRWLPTVDQYEGLPKQEMRKVVVSLADAYSGGRGIAQIAKGTRLLVRQRGGDWVGVYWQVDGAKRLLWVKSASLGEPIDLAAGDLHAFLGKWRGTWADVKVEGLTITEKDGEPEVTQTGMTITDAKFDDGKLTYHRVVLASGWEFEDTLTLMGNMIGMSVHRLRDDAMFNGTLKKM
jgi:tetratricopeptide (TPR) repeat protein